MFTSCVVQEKQVSGGATALWNSDMQDLSMASSFLWWTRQIQSQVQTGKRWEGRPFPCQLLSTCVLPPAFPVYDPKNSKIGYSDNTTMVQMPGGSRCVHSKCEWEIASLQKAGHWQCSVTCLWERMLSHFKGDYDRQNNEAAENRATAITRFHLGFEGQWFWRV